MAPLHSLSGYAKALLLFAVVGPLVGISGLLAVSTLKYSISLNDPNTSLVVLVYELLGIPVALMAGVAFLLMLHLAVLMKRVIASAFTICTLGALAGGLSSWFSFWIIFEPLGFAASVEGYLVLTGIIGGAFCGFLCRRMLIAPTAPNHGVE